MSNRLLAYLISVAGLVVTYFYLTDGYFSSAAMWGLAAMILTIGLFRAYKHNDWVTLGFRLLGVLVTGYTAIAYLQAATGRLVSSVIEGWLFDPLMPYFVSLITFEAFVKLIYDARKESALMDASQSGRSLDGALRYYKSAARK